MKDLKIVLLLILFYASSCEDLSVNQEENELDQITESISQMTEKSFRKELLSIPNYLIENSKFDQKSISYSSISYFNSHYLNNSIKDVAQFTNGLQIVDIESARKNTNSRSSSLEASLFQITFPSFKKNF